MSEHAFIAAVAAGYEAVTPQCDLICLGEMGIGNTTAAAALAAALFGGGGTRWAGRGTGVDADGLARKRAVIDRALAHHAAPLHDPLRVAAALGGRELAAILGAVLRARREHIPVLLDGFVCTAAVAPLAKLRTDTLAHTLAGHVSAESGHRMLLDELKLKPIVDLDMRLGEASGAALAVLILRAALACHSGMATFAQAGVSDKPAMTRRRSRKRRLTSKPIVAITRFGFHQHSQRGGCAPLRPANRVKERAGNMAAPSAHRPQRAPFAVKKFRERRVGAVGGASDA